MADSQLGKRMAKYGVIGAIIAIPVPFIGPIIGAAAGAGYAYYKSKKQGSGGSLGSGRY